MQHTILLFEDNPEIRGLVSELLAEEGYRVLRAGSLWEVGALVEGGGVDMVLADSGEATRGRALAAYLHWCRAIGDRVPMLVFTAHQLTDEEARGAGCAAVLSKPFDVDRLLELVAGQLAGRREG